MTIELNSVSFRYSTPAGGSGTLKNAVLAITKGYSPFETRFAIKDLDLKIDKGEVFGVIGKNGSGKSTLVKLIAGIVKPSKGSVRTEGRVAVMVSLGAGFHPDLTAYENVLLYGALMGTKVEVMKERANVILEWAELGDYVNNQVRTFSSGMIARLAFAVATDLEPQILLVDEVLSVGDKDFQKKSQERMFELIASGCSVVFVSHDLNTLAKICKRTLLLENGAASAVGNTEDVINKYLDSPSH